MSVLVALAARPGDVITRDELIEAVWGGRIVTDDALNRCIAELRQVLNAGGTTDPIVTVPRVGYRLTLPVAAVLPDADPLGARIPLPPATTPPTAAPSRRSLPRAYWIAVAILGIGALLATGSALLRVGVKSSQHAAVQQEPGDAGANAPAMGPPGTLAVLPLENLTGDPGNEYLSDGLTDELRDQLASLPGIRVTSRNSAFAFKGKNIPVGEIGRRLGVRRVLEGSVRRDTDRLRVTVQLVETGSAIAAWSHSFDRSSNSAVELQRDIARAVAAQLQVATPPPAGPEHSPNADAYRQYLLGRSAFGRRRDAASVEEAIRDFDEAVRLDPAFGMAHAMLAASRAVLPTYRESVDRIASCELAETSARRALAVEPMNGLAYAVIGYCAFGSDPVNAERNLQHALSLSPQLVDIHLWYAELLLDVGRIDAAVEEGERSVALDPMSGPAYAFLAEANFLKGDYARAMMMAGRSQSLGVPDIRQILSKVALAHGNVEESARLWSASDGIDLGVARLVSAALIDDSKLPAARAPLESELNRIPWPARGWSRLNMRLLLGDVDGALAALDEMEVRVGRRRALHGFAGADLWDPQSQVRSRYQDPRFQTLLARTGLRSYYVATGIPPDLCQWVAEALACTPRDWRAPR